jgi:hypothetical protein
MYIPTLQQVENYYLLLITKTVPGSWRGGASWPKFTVPAARRLLPGHVPEQMPAYVPQHEPELAGTIRHSELARTCSGSCQLIFRLYYKYIYVASVLLL